MDIPLAAKPSRRIRRVRGGKMVHHQEGRPDVGATRVDAGPSGATLRETPTGTVTVQDSLSFIGIRRDKDLRRLIRNCPTDWFRHRGGRLSDGEIGRNRIVPGENPSRVPG